MLWDASQAYGKYICLALEVRKLKGDLEANGRYDVAIKNALSAAGGTGFTFPSCSAPAFVSGTNYAGGSQVSFDGKVIKTYIRLPWLTILPLFQVHLAS